MTPFVEGSLRIGEQFAVDLEAFPSWYVVPLASNHGLGLLQGDAGCFEPLYGCGNCDNFMLAPGAFASPSRSLALRIL